MTSIKKVLIEIGHPGQVHQFKYLYKELTNNGIEVLVVSKSKEVSVFLLKVYNLKYKIIDKTKKGLIRKLFNLPSVYFKMYKIIKSFKPDIILSRFSFQSSHLAKICGIPHIGFTDTEHVILSDKLTVPFVNVKITANSYTKDLGKNHFRYDGNIELFYLHPDRFKADALIIQELGLRENEKFAIVRFVSWNAHHDIGQKGFSLNYKYELINELSKYSRVYITSEAPLPEELLKYQIKISPEKMHSALYYASLYIGEGGTMASEAACLGTPSIYVNSLDAGVFRDEVKYKLLYSYRNTQGLIENVKQLLGDKDLENSHIVRRKKMLKDKIDVTEFLVWFIENYPKSVNVMKENPDYQLNFM